MTSIKFWARGAQRPAFMTIAVTTVLLFVAAAIFVPNSLDSVSLTGMLPFAAVLAIASIGQTLVIQQRGIDLSAAGVISLSAMSLGVMHSRWGLDGFVAMGLTFAIAAFFGLLNGLLVTLVGISPLVATLAMNAVLYGFVQLITGGAPAQAPEIFSSFVQQKFFGVSTLVWIAVVTVAVMAVVTSKTVLGRRFIAAGASPAAARASGVNPNFSVIVAYVTAALTYSFAGMLLAAYLKNVGVQVGNGYMLAVIATVIVGGTPLTGGKGTIVGTAIAALFLSQLIQMVLTMGAPSSVQMLVEASTIAIAATLQGLTGRGKRLRLPDWLRPQARQAAT